MKELFSINSFVPNFIDEVMMYFASKSGETVDDGRKRTLETLSQHLKTKYSFEAIQYHKEIVAICDSLCEVAPLIPFYQDNYFGYRNCYYWNEKIKNGKTYPELSLEERKPFFTKWENAVFGPRYIYYKYRDYVLPIVYEQANNDPGIGTGFLVGSNIIVTARHCIEGSTNISFGKIPYEKYRNAKVYYHSNPNIDIAIILIAPLDIYGLNLSNEFKIFEKVITMGYPKIPGFTCFQTAEEAVVSAVPEKRFTVTEGQVAAEAQQLWSRENLFLITAKVKGGNSGGPVINQYGYCIGLVSQEPFAEGGYDDLGYGTAVPARFVIDVITDVSQHQQVENINFVEYSE